MVNAHFHDVQLLLLGHDLFDIRLELGICVYDLLSYRALSGRLDLGLCAGCEAVIEISL